MELTKEQILKIHDSQIAKHGGEYGVREEGTFDMLVNAPYQSVFGVDCYPSVFDKAAKLLEGFARHQVFYDGNKRTALVSCGTFLAVNSYHLQMGPMEFYNLTLQIANNKDVSIEEISKILESCCIEIDKNMDFISRSGILEEKI